MSSLLHVKETLLWLLVVGDGVDDSSGGGGGGGICVSGTENR